MSESLEVRAELLKLARLWECESEEIGFLAQLPASDLRELRELATEVLFDANAALFAAVGAATKLVPSGVAATIAERVFGPLLCARAAGNADPRKAVDIARRLPERFLTDVTLQLDPRRVSRILAEVPLELTVAVTRRLGERGEYVTMGRFLGFIDDRAVAAAVEVLSDEALLRTAFVLEDKGRLDHAIGLLAPVRLERLIRCASELGLWGEALDLLDHLSDGRRAPIADLYAEQPPEVIAGLVASATADDLWGELLPVVGVMSARARARLAGLAPFHDTEVLAAIITAASEPGAGLWQDLAPLVAELPPEARARAAQLIGELESERIQSALAESVASPQALAPLISLLPAMDEAGRTRISTALAALAVDQPDA